MHKFKKNIFILVLVSALLLSGCSKKVQESEDYMTVWYIEGDPAADALISLSEEYNSVREAGIFPADFRAFPNEKSLAAAFEANPPDLLLCSHVRAFALYERGVLRDIFSAVSMSVSGYPSWLTDRSASIGKCFFPLGSEVLLLYAKDGIISADSLTNPDSFCKAAVAYTEKNHSPFFTADSFSDLIYQLLLSQGSEFHAVKSADISQENYGITYNLLAETAYQGALVSADYKGADLVKSGYVPCAVVGSGSLSGADNGLEIYAVPCFNANNYRLSNTFGLAVTAKEGRSLRSVNAFIGWLLNTERMSALALESGLVPTVEGAVFDESNLSSVLKELYSNFSFHLPDYGSDYVKNHMDFEADFRRALSELGVY